MQGQKGAGKSSAETINLNQGSDSRNSGSNQPTAWNSMLYPMDNHNVQTFDGWHFGESSSSASPNLQSHGLGGDVMSDCSFDTPLSAGPSNILPCESLSRPLSGSTQTPLNINLNAEHMASGSDWVPETAYTFPNSAENNDGASSSSLGDWGSSFKRKALDGGSSNCYQLGEAFDTHDFHAHQSGSSSLNMSAPPRHPPSCSHSEELSLRIGRGVASDVSPPISRTEAGESPSTNYGIRVNHDYDRFNLPSTRNTMRQSEFFNRRQSSRPISPTDTFEFRPASSSARNQAQWIHASELSTNAPPFSFHGDASRTGGSLSSASISAERGISSLDEENSASSVRNSVEHSPFAHFSEIRNNLNISPENGRNSSSHFPTPWATSQHRGSEQNSLRSSQISPWAPLPSADSESGSWRRGHFPPLRAGPSSSEEMIMSSGTNQDRRRHHTPFPRPSMMMELPSEDASGWAALAGIERRQRLIRHALNAIHRGDNLRDEDYMLFGPFINGTAEFHDRHRDMRLDVDNMSYEELLALEERIGDVSTGLSEEAILRSMKQRKHLCLFDQPSSTLEPCSICREEYILGDNVGELDCGHDFHTDCIKQWLTQKNLCPICKMTALGT